MQSLIIHSIHPSVHPLAAFIFPKSSSRGKKKVLLTSSRRFSNLAGSSASRPCPVLRTVSWRVPQPERMGKGENGKESGEGLFWQRRKENRKSRGAAQTNHGKMIWKELCGGRSFYPFLIKCSIVTAFLLFFFVSTDFEWFRLLGSRITIELPSIFLALLWTVDKRRRRSFYRIMQLFTRDLA